MNDIRRETADALQRFDDLPRGSLHLKILFACVVALGFDLGEIAISGALSAIFSSGPNAATSTQLAWLLASVYIGGTLGAWPCGVLADRFGRKNLITALLALLALASTAGAFSPNVVYLAVVRGFAGLALGVLPVIIIAYLTDMLPPSGRASWLMSASALGFAGTPLFLLLLNAIQNWYGADAAWRGTLLFGGLGAAACAALFIRLPESPHWLVAQQRFAAAEVVVTRFEQGAGTTPEFLRRAHSSLRRARVPRPVTDYRGRLLLVCVLCVLAPLVTIAFPVLSGAILVERGFSLSNSILYVAVSSFGYIVGALLVAPLLDRMERAVGLALTAATMILGLVTFAIGETALLVTIGSGLFLAGAAVYITSLNIYAAELFPLGVRATMTSISWGLLRLTAVSSLFALVPLLRGRGPAPVFMVMVSSLLLSALIVYRFGPRSENA